jgi:hypothetical protein
MGLFSQHQDHPWHEHDPWRVGLQMIVLAKQWTTCNSTKYIFKLERLWLTRKSKQLGKNVEKLSIIHIVLMTDWHKYWSTISVKYNYLSWLNEKKKIILKNKTKNKSLTQYCRFCDLHVLMQRFWRIWRVRYKFIAIRSYKKPNKY